MKRESIIQLLIILIGLPIGAYFSNYSLSSHEKIEHKTSRNHANMEHGLLDISQDAIIPHILLFEVSKDSMSGWNIWIETENFRFAPEHVSQAHIPGEGHAHLYVNGKKYTRIYGPYFHIPTLENENNEFRITLNANGHETLAIEEKPIEKRVSI